MDYRMMQRARILLTLSLAACASTSGNSAAARYLYVWAARQFGDARFLIALHED